MSINCKVAVSTETEISTQPLSRNTHLRVQFSWQSRHVSVRSSHTYLCVMIMSPLAAHKHTQTHNKMSSRRPLLRCHSLKRVYQPGADVSHLLICVLSLFTRRDVSDIIRLHPAPPPHHPLFSHQFCGSVSWEPHKISLKTTRSAEANLWAPFILITTLWKKLFNAICVIVCWTDCWVPVSLVLHEKDIKSFFFSFCQAWEGH